MISWFKAFIDIFFPDYCLCCGANLGGNQNYICVKCIYNLPKTNFHLIEDNPVAQIFWGRIQFAKATSFFHFQKGTKYQKLIHELKYKGQKEIGELLGKHFANDLENVNYLNGVDYLIPVPLHFHKQNIRGYNQSEWIARGLSKRLDIEIRTDILIRKGYSESQTGFGRSERFENVKDDFEVKHTGVLKGKHIAIVDDVITTGATIEACVSKINNAADTKITILSIGFAN